MTVATGDVPGRIFMSYRREDTDYPAAWLYERLASHFRGDQVFKDIDSIELGDDFVEVITTAVQSCEVLLALIGNRWLTAAGRDGQRRLEDPNDFVRVEIEAALTRGVRVIPVLVEGARMPRADELPATLAGLTRRQALELSPSRFDLDTQRLLAVLERTITQRQDEDAPQPNTPAPRRAGQAMPDSRSPAHVPFTASQDATGHKAADESASEDEDYLTTSAAAVREHNRQELVEALLGQGYIKSRNSDVYALPQNPDFRVKFGKTVVRFEVRVGDTGYGRPWQLGSSYLLTREHGEALRAIRSPRQMIEKSLRGLGSSREELAKRLAPRNAGLNST